MAAVSWSGLDDGVYGIPYAIKYGDSSRRRFIQNIINHRAMRSDAGLIAALLGAASGGAALRTHNEVSPPATSNDIGGKRVIGTINDVNRNTTAGDITALNAYLTTSGARAPTYPGDKSGNGK